MDYPCTKFGDCIFSRFDFNVGTDRIIIIIIIIKHLYSVIESGDTEVLVTSQVD